MFRRKKLLLEKTTPYGEVFVYENRTARWLSFDDEFVQTIINKQVPHQPKLAYIRELCALMPSSAKSAVLLGAGGGGLIHYLHRYFSSLSLSAIEINSEIINIARDYFFLTHPLICADGFTYLDTMDDTDCLLIDLFQGSTLPKQLCDSHVYQLCQSKISQTLSVNLLCKNQLIALKTVQLIRHVFDKQTLCLNIPGRKNLVIHAFKSRAFFNEIESACKKGRIKRPFWDNDLGMVSSLL